MGGVYVCHSWTCRTAWPLFLLLASMAGVLHCSESPPAVVGKMYPRGNHWAVGHLMGKKSVGLPFARGDTGQVGEVVTPRQLQPYVRLMEALVQHKSRRQTTQPSALRLLWLHDGWREEDRDKYLREIAELLFQALKLQDRDSS